MRGAFTKNTNAALQWGWDLSLGVGMREREEERECVLANLWRSWFVTVNVFLIYLLNF